jgi:replicative DNA helicase
VPRACRELTADGAPVDIRTLQAKLEHRGEFERIGGLAYLASLDLDLPDIRRVGAFGSKAAHSGDLLIA